MRRTALTLSILLVGAVVAAPASTALPVTSPLSASATSVSYQATRSGVVSAAWTSHVGIKSPYVLDGASVLATSPPISLRGSLPDADAHVTVSYVPSRNPIDFDGTPVAVGKRIYPFLWARKGQSNAVEALAGTEGPPPVLMPGDSYDATTVVANWPVVDSGNHGLRRAATGHLVVDVSAPMVNRAGYRVTGQSATATVTSLTGTVLAAGGDVTGHRRATIRVPLPSGGLDNVASLLVYYLYPPQMSDADWSVAADGSRSMKLSVAVKGRLPQAASERTSVGPVALSAIPFMIVAVSGPVLGPVTTAATFTPGTHAMAWTPRAGAREFRALPGQRVTLTPGGLVIGGGGTCVFGMQQSDDRADVTAAPAASGTPSASGWRIGRVRRSEIDQLSLGTVNVDGTAWTPTLAQATFRSQRPVVPWEDDWTQLVTQDVYDSLTSLCAWGDPHHQVTNWEKWPGSRFGMEQRSVYVGHGILLDVRVAAAPDSRLSYVANGMAAKWPVLRLRVGAFSLDGQMHQVQLTTRLRVHGVGLSLSTDAGAAPLSDGTYSSQNAQFLLAGSHGLSDAVVAGDLAASYVGTDLNGRFGGAASTLTATHVTAGSQFGEIDCASSPVPQAAAPAFFTGYLTAVLAQSS